MNSSRNEIVNLKMMTTRTSNGALKRRQLKRACEIYFLHGLEKKPKRDVISTTKLTDLNCDCLCSIFKLLDVKEVIQMAKVDVQFVEPVNMILRKINKHTTFSSVNCKWKRPPATFSEFVVVEIDLWKYVGQSVLKLWVDFDYVLKNVAPVLEDCILKHCVALKELTLKNFDDGVLESIDKPFEKLEILTLSNGTLGRNFCQFVKWFPALRSLSVNCKIPDESYVSNMAKTIPTLEFISLSLNKKLTTGMQPQTHLCKIDDVIKSNGDVKSVCLNFGCTPRDLRLVNKELKQLETLEIHIQPFYFKQGWKRPIKFESVKKLIVKIDQRYFPLCSHLPIKTPMLGAMIFDRLEELEMNCGNCFLEKSDSLKKLTLRSELYCEGQLTLSEISSKWPNLIDVTLDFTIIDGPCADVVTQFIQSLQNLQRFNVLSHMNSYIHRAVLDEFKIVEINLSNKYAVLYGAEGCLCSIVRQT